MNHLNASNRVTAEHLRRSAYLYVRQSSLRQVVENTESGRRQYALRERAIALGWQAEQLVVVDQDQGRSGASSAGREGFQRLVADVGLGRAGIVLGLEVSRLARNSSDWHRLLEISALTNTLILDEDGLYDPSHFNDRLLLGMKGTMSEAELHVLRARLRGGILAKARRGELKLPLPVGLVYDREGHVILHPDARIRDTVSALFDTYARTASAYATVRFFHEQGWLFPARATQKNYSQEVIWKPLRVSRAATVLHNPRYAGAYAYGRSRSRLQPDGRYRGTRLPREEWKVLLLDAHPGYISWSTYERNERTTAALEEHGVTCLGIDDSELVRGLGGPRCMTMPLRRS